MSDSRTALAFDEADLRRWERDFEMNAPSAKDRTEATDCPHVVSLRSQASAYGFAMRVKLADGSEADMFLNVIAARALALSILDAGAQGGWMFDPNRITIPRIPASKKRKV